jgi:steroid 5-alpha reductase family enzyme
MAPAAEPGALGALGAAVAATGLLTEATADRQLDRFKATAAPDALCREGLRAYVRFPHYAGEMAMWAGVALIAVEAGVWWAPASAALIIALLIKVSGAPMMDEHLARSRPGYAEWKATTPAFVPERAAMRAAARRALG